MFVFVIELKYIQPIQTSIIVELHGDMLLHTNYFKRLNLNNLVNYSIRLAITNMPGFSVVLMITHLSKAGVSETITPIV